MGFFLTEIDYAHRRATKMLHLTLIQGRKGFIEVKMDLKNRIFPEKQLLMVFWSSMGYWLSMGLEFEKVPPPIFSYSYKMPIKKKLILFLKIYTI